MVEYPPDESIWRRGCKDTWVGWKNPLFGILDAVVCVVVGYVFGWYWGIGLFLFVMFAVWIGATASAPIKQRNEARRKLMELQDRLGEVGYIEGFIMEANNTLIKLRHYGIIDDYARGEFRKWRDVVCEHLEKNDKIHENLDWHRKTSIDITKSSYEDIVKAYEAGADVLMELLKKLIG